MATPLPKGYSKMAKPYATICIYCDSQSSIGRLQNIMYNGKSRHIRHGHNTIRQLLLTGVISLDNVKFKENAVDPLTKWLIKQRVS